MTTKTHGNHQTEKGMSQYKIQTPKTALFFGENKTAHAYHAIQIVTQTKRDISPAHCQNARKRQCQQSFQKKTEFLERSQKRVLEIKVPWKVYQNFL